MTDWLYPAASRRFRPWKNGGGQTAEIAVSPEGAGFDDFDWRISTAIVAGSGPFSTFPGIDRWLAVIEGGPMQLKVGDVTHQLDAAAPPLAFPGDAPAEAELTGPPLLDFNLMTRRPISADMRRMRLDGAGVRFALLLADAGGLKRLDLVDIAKAPADVVAALQGAEIIAVVIS